MSLNRTHPAIRAAIPMLLLLSACQGMITSAPVLATLPPVTSPAPTATRTPPAATPTVPPPVLTPTRTPRPSATPSPAPSAAAQAAQVELAPGGPWLLYQRALLSGEGGFTEALFVSNADGSGSRAISALDSSCAASAPAAIAEDPANRLVTLGGQVVLVNQGRAAAQVVSPGCKTRFTGSAAGGLLAMIDRRAAELRVYELPAGRLRGAFPLQACAGSAQACGFDTSTGAWVAQWDPSGRYLVFPANLGEAQSDLYLYDAQKNAARRLASIQGQVSALWWSPRGSNILLGVSPGGDFFLDSFWAVAATGGAAKRLSTGGDFLGDVTLLDWLDEDRFLFYRGSLQYVATVGAADLRMLDIRRSQETVLLRDGFIMAGLDRQSGVVGMVVAVYNSQYEDGLYLVPLARPTPQKIASLETQGLYNTYWDAQLRLFVSEDPCADSAPGVRAFDAQGRWQCVLVASATETPPAPSQPSPDGHWRAAAQNGLWVEGPGRPAAKVQDLTPTQVIWRPDSAGLFFIARQTLYYLSLPDLAVHPLDSPGQLSGGLRWGSDQVAYRWVESSGGQ